MSMKMQNGERTLRYACRTCQKTVTTRESPIRAVDQVEPSGSCTQSLVKKSAARRPSVR